LFDSAETDDRDAEHDQTVIIPSEPETMAETVRRTGLAWSAGIAFFAAVVFMIVLGWGADVLLGTSPWGIVGGIVLGSVIGFIQFFRITSQIFKK
jgi:F0F1-type ATP synthase assembly protein I